MSVLKLRKAILGAINAISQNDSQAALSILRAAITPDRSEKRKQKNIKKALDTARQKRYTRRVVDSICRFCNRQWRQYTARDNPIVYCSTDCRKAAMAGEGSPQYRGGSVKSRGPKWRKLAEEIRQRDKNTCQRCGKTGPSFPVDHVYPVRWFPVLHEANERANLITLCVECHGYKTSYVEPALLRGDMVTFNTWLRQIGYTTAPPTIKETEKTKTAQGGPSRSNSPS